MILDAAGDPPPPAAIATAVAALRAGDPVVLPTDTVYGLAADPFRAEATRRLFAVKRRPEGVPVAILVADAAQAAALADDLAPGVARLLADAWPGALTVVVRRRPGVLLHLGDTGATVGLRCPDHPVPRAVAAAVGPIATTSANRHGQPTPSTAPAVAAALGGEVEVILDGGPGGGVPTTVVDCTSWPPTLLRAGAVPFATLLASPETS